MAKMSFTSSNRANEIENFPKLKLENKESARVVVLEEPESAFVHNLRAPKIVNGVVQYKGEEMDFDFMGNPICLGDENIVKERGMDAKNCPACKAVQEQPDMFTIPKRKYATHVYQYQTNGTNKAPANGEGSVKVWAFADQKFGELIDIYEEAEKSPVDVDLILGPCENAMFQKFKIIAGQKTAWQTSDASKQRFEDSVASNKSKDLYRYIGRKMSSEFIVDKIDEVRRKWAQAKGQSGETANDGFVSAERNLDAGLEDLLKDDSKPVTQTQSSSKGSPSDSSGNEAVDLDDLLASLDED